MVKKGLQTLHFSESGHSNFEFFFEEGDELGLEFLGIFREGPEKLACEAFIADLSFHCEGIFFAFKQ